jgi:hypothetical protein
LLTFLKLTNTDPFATWSVVTRDATPDGIRVVRSVLGAISSLPRPEAHLECGLRGEAAERGDSGDTTPYRMTGMTLRRHARYEKMQRA